MDPAELAAERGRNHYGLYLRIFEQPETLNSGDTIIFLCEDCLAKTQEGAVDLSRQQTSVALGP